MDSVLAVIYIAYKLLYAALCIQLLGAYLLMTSV